jgi:hypothetical protein
VLAILKNKKDNPEQFSRKNENMRQAPADKEFFLSDGRGFRNLKELYLALIDMPKEIFYYHVNESNKKNDFAKWISEVLQDKKLAMSLEKARDQKKYSNIIGIRLKELRVI